MNGLAAIDHRLQGAVDTNAVPGVVAIAASSDQILYEGAFGSADEASDVAMQTDTIFEIMSMTKPVTSLAVMMLYEEGRLDLDEPIANFIPSLGRPEVISHFDERDGSFTTRPARRQITIRHLLTNTSGFGYGFSSHTLYELEKKTGRTFLQLPLLHEPGEKWTYGPNTRILGDLVEAISGSSIDDFYRARIFGPLGMDDSGYLLSQEHCRRWVTLQRRINGVLHQQRKPQKQEPAIFGDYGLLSTARDYVAFLQLFLNGGAAPNGRLLRQESVNMMTSNQIGDLVVETQPGADRALSRAFPLGAGKDKFGLGFQIAAANGGASNGRSPGSCSWSGLKNTHFWVDLKRGIAGVILMQVLPFYDEACIKLYSDFEELVYRHLVDPDGEDTQST